MTVDVETVVFLHGLGAGPTSWAAQLTALPAGFEGFTPQLAGLDDETATFSLASSAGELVRELDRRAIGRAHLCGLSLGAMVATQCALDFPDRVASLVLSGGQVHPNPALMKFQGALMRALPERLVTAPGLGKRRMLQVVDAVARTDFRGDLSRIATPTLVMCGLKDRANVPAARQLAEGIPDARLQLDPGAGHEWNTQLPEEFNARLRSFYEGLASRR